MPAGAALKLTDGVDPMAGFPQNGFPVRQVQAFEGGVAGISALLDRFENPLHVRMPIAREHAVGIRQMHMGELFSH